MDRGVPFLTLDPATGEMVARYDDGTVSPLPQGGFNASDRLSGGTRPGEQQAPFIRPITGGTGVSRSSGPVRGSGGTSGGDVASEAIPPPGGGGGGYVDARARLAAARARISGALGGGYSSGGSSGYDSDSSIPSPDDRRLHGRYARGLDPAQAAGLSYRPTAMLPRVFPGLTPADPLYNTLASLPVGQWATILGKGTPQSLANKTGQIYQRAGTTGNIPSTDRLLKSLGRGRGVETMFEGEKAGPNDYQSTLAPGYVYGQEPMPMAEAATTFGSLLDAALSQEPVLTAQKYSAQPGGWGSFLIDRWASKAMKKPAGKSKPVYKSVTRRLFR